MERLSGVVIPMVTPLTEDDRIDTESLRALTDHCIEGGMTCLYPCGTTGEMMYLSVEERKLAAETVVRRASGRVPVFVHVGAWNLRDTVDLARHAVQIGADGIGVVTPVFYNVSDAGIIDYYKTVAGSVPDDFPVYLYGIKQNAVNDLTPYVCEEVKKACANVIGAKYSFPDMTRLQELMTVNDGKFDVLVGPDHLFEVVCAAGGKGVVSGNAMIIPEHYKALWEAILSKDFDLAAKLQRRTNILNSVICAVNNIAAYKVILKKEGVIQTSNVRRPMENLTAKQEEELMERLKELDYKTVRI